MNINKTGRKVGFHKLSIPKPKKPKLIPMPKLPKLKAYGSFPKGHVY